MPAKPLLPSAVIACWASRWAFSADQPGVSYSLATVDPGGFEPFVGACLEEGGVGVGRVAVDHDDRAAGAAVFFQFFRQRFGLQFADFFVVEGDVGVDFAVFDQAVVAEHRHVLGLCLFGDRRGRFRVHRVDDEDFGALGQRRFGLALLLLGVAAGVAVDDFAVGALFFDRFFEVRPVVGFVARRFVFRQQEGDLGATAVAAAAAARGDQGDHEQRSEPRTEIRFSAVGLDIRLLLLPGFHPIPKTLDIDHTHPTRGLNQDSGQAGQQARQTWDAAS